MGSWVWARGCARRLSWAIGLAAVAVASTGAPAPAATRAAITTSAPCGAMAGQPSTVHKVLVIVMENTSFGSVIGASGAPTINALANACGLASSYHGIQFPSLPNYLELTSGTAPSAIAGNGRQGVDCSPGPNCQSTDPSIFSQLDAAGLSWRSYAESMPRNCALANAGEYAARHNPAVYYVNERATCAVNDVPMGSPAGGALARDLSGGSLPSYGFVAPNLCNDGHDSCGGVSRVVEEDRTVAAWLPAIVASPDYQSGALTVVVTADTSSGSDATNHLATIVVSPFVPAHTVANVPLDHYSLLRMSERLTGLDAYLNRAATATDMLAPFGLAPAAGTGVPPAAPVITAAPAPISTATAASFAMSTATGGARLACALDAGEWLPCTSPAAYSGLAVGTHRFRVRAVSEAGVSSPATATWTVAAATQSLIDGLQATPFATRSAITLRLAAPADASLVIFDAAGHPVRRLFVGRALPAGVTTVSWYGYCDPPSAVRLPPGSYRVRLTAVAAGSMQISRTAITIPTLSGAVRRA